MNKITDQDPISKSADILQGNIQKLKSLFPEIITEGSEGTAINVDVLKSLVGDRTVTDADEKYGLTWHGKRKARQLALTPSTGTLRPAPEDSVDWDTTKNLMIEGDNLEVLKLLQKSYAGKIKMIYIDPPYNTGKDFVYKDDFRDNISNYLEVTGQKEGDRKLSTNTESSGRYHTDWLNMMYPRLKLAHSLLKDDGVIFISIDDVEASNTRKICDEIFGEDNFIANVIWEKKYSPQNDAKWFSDTHDHILVYAKTKDNWFPNLLPRTEEQNSRYTNRDNDPRGPWKSSDFSVKTYTKSYDYPIETPSGRIINPPNSRCWRTSKDQFKKLVLDNRIWFGEDGNNVPSIKRFLSEVKQGIVPMTIWKYKEVGHNQDAANEIRDLFDGYGYFDTPKPIELLKRIIYLSSNSNDIIMDFFSGSGTTAHSTLIRNLLDNTKRRYILIQLPELLDTNNSKQRPAYEFCLSKGHPTNIAELTKERLRRAGNKIREENPLFAGDLGFRVFKLDSTNILEWDINSENLEESLQMSIDHLKSDRSEDDILYEILLKLGLDLCVPMEKKVIGGKTVHSVGGGVLMACLDKQIAREDVETLALGMIDWHEELAPEADTTVIFRDSAFKDDIAKTNLSAILEQYGIKNVRSL